jgi:hypothetical protein
MYNRKPGKRSKPSPTLMHVVLPLRGAGVVRASNIISHLLQHGSPHHISSITNTAKYLMGMWNMENNTNAITGRISPMGFLSLSAASSITHDILRSHVQSIAGNPTHMRVLTATAIMNPNLACSSYSAQGSINKGGRKRITREIVPFGMVTVEMIREKNKFPSTRLALHLDAYKKQYGIQWCAPSNYNDRLAKLIESIELLKKKAPNTI